MARPGVDLGGSPQAYAGNDPVNQHESSPHEDGGRANGTGHFKQGEDETGEHQVSKQRDGNEEDPEGEDERYLAAEQSEQYAGLFAAFVGVFRGVFVDFGGTLACVAGGFAECHGSS